MNRILLRSDPTAILRTIGSSRLAAIPRTYCGVTAVSSTTTPAAFALARPAAAPTSSTDAAAIRASVAMSSNRPNSPALMAEGYRAAMGSSASASSMATSMASPICSACTGCGPEVDRLLHVPLGVAERVDRVRQHPGDRAPGQQQREARGGQGRDQQGDGRVVVGPAHVAGVLGALDEEAVEQVDDQRRGAHAGEPAADPRDHGEERPRAEQADDEQDRRASRGPGRRSRRARRTGSGSRATRSAPACRSRWWPPRSRGRPRSPAWRTQGSRSRSRRSGVAVRPSTKNGSRPRIRAMSRVSPA